LYSLLTKPNIGNNLFRTGILYILKTIYIVDDSDTNLAMAEEALEDYFRILTLPSAAKMFTLLEKIIPDLILLDIEMPEMNGFDALERLKASSSWSSIPVIFLTGTKSDSIEEKSKKLGAVGLVSKPFSPPELLDLVNSQF